jgi:periplasmic protein TonB
MSSVAANYRSFRLPWTPSEAEERLFRRIMGAIIGLFIAFGIVIPLLPTPPKPEVADQVMPERIVEFILEQKKPPEKVEPPKPVEKPKVEAKVEQPMPARVVPKPDPRKKAQQNMQALAQDLAALRDIDVKDVNDAPINAGVGNKADVSRNILTAKVGSGSGGIATSPVSSGFGAGTTGLKGNSTARVTSPVPQVPEATRTGSGKGASRSREEVELVFDKNKSAIYALYSRALRDNPSLQGKVVLEVTIAPSGDVTACRVVSSELNDPELERKLVARVKMFKFPARDVATMTTTKPIEFFPA